MSRESIHLPITHLRIPVFSDLIAFLTPVTMLLHRIQSTQERSTRSAGPALRRHDDSPEADGRGFEVSVR